MSVIAICPNAFRGNLTAIDATQIIADGLQQSKFNCTTLHMPLADGGDGTLDVWLQATQGERVAVDVDGPLANQVKAIYGRSGDTALIEMARASGVELLAIEQRNPLYTSTYGTGQLIKHAIEHGAKRILVGVGGSATVDGGAGALQALGAGLIDKAGNPVERGGGALNAITRVDIQPVQAVLQDVSIEVLCDVDNPLLGERGAAPVFGRQKGADAQGVQMLNANLAHFADILARDTGVQVHHIPRTGAAGGLSAGLMAGCNANLVSGADHLIEVCGYEQMLTENGVNLVITAEGKLDDQSEEGKAPQRIASLAAKLSIPTVAFSGNVSLTPNHYHQLPVVAAYSIVQQPCTLEEAMQRAEQWLMQSAINLGNVLALREHWK